MNNQDIVVHFFVFLVKKIKSFGNLLYFLCFLYTKLDKYMDQMLKFSKTKMKRW